MIKTNRIDYIKKLEEENKLLKNKLLKEIENSNLLVLSEKLKNQKLLKEISLLKQKNALLSLLAI